MIHKLVICIQRGSLGLLKNCIFVIVNELHLRSVTFFEYPAVCICTTRLLLVPLLLPCCPGDEELDGLVAEVEADKAAAEAAKRAGPSGAAPQTS